MLLRRDCSPMVWCHPLKHTCDFIHSDCKLLLINSKICILSISSHYFGKGKKSDKDQAKKIEIRTLIQNLRGKFESRALSVSISLLKQATIRTRTKIRSNSTIQYKYIEDVSLTLGLI